MRLVGGVNEISARVPPTIESKRGGKYAAVTEDGT